MSDDELTDDSTPMTDTTDTADESDELATTATTIDTESIITYLQWGGLVVLGIFAIVGGFGLYTSLGSIIDVWVTAEYQPFARALMNLLVVSVSITGILVLIKRH